MDAQGATSPYTKQDQMMQELYNSTTVYDDLTWAAAWLYKATREDTYLAMLHFACGLITWRTALSK